MQIRPSDPRHPQIVALLQEHLADMASHSPPESCHALDVEGLCTPQISFFAAWDGDQLMGTAALSQLDARHGEVKSMRTVQAHRRKGVAAALLQHLLATAKARGYQRLSLETGAMAAFAPAIALYRQHGFTECPPFGSYCLDRNSLFMHLNLTAAMS